MQGHVIQFSYTESFGSIHPDDDSGDVRFVASSVEGSRSLQVSERVEFDVIYGPTGPEAVDVRRL